MSDFTKWVNEFITPGQPQEILPGRRVHLGVQAMPVGLTADQAMEMAARLVECSHMPGQQMPLFFNPDREPTTNERHLFNLLSWREKEAQRYKEEIAVLREQLNVAATRSQRFRDALLRLAARANDYTLSDIWANVADALEVSVAELAALVEDTA